MGLPFVDLLRYTKRQREAAKQMWNFVKSGVSFEIPVSLSTDDTTMKALECMVRAHPEVVMGQKASNGAGGAPLTLQSRGIVVGLRQNIAAGSEAMKVLQNYGYQPDAKGGLKELFENHEAFIRRQARLEPEEAVAQAQLDAKVRNAIVLTDQSAARAEEATTPVPELTVVAPGNEGERPNLNLKHTPLAHQEVLHDDVT